MRRVLALAATALALGAGACGGGDDDAGGAITKAEFAQRADAVCTRGTREFGAVQQQIADARDAQGRLAALDAFERSVQGLDRDIAALPRPSGADGDTAARFQETFRAVVAGFGPVLERARAAASRSADAVRQVFNRAELPAAQENEELARQLGARVCSGDVE